MEEVVVNYEEVLEKLYGEMRTQTELLTEIKEQDMSLLDVARQGFEEHQEVGVAVGVFCVFAIMDFCWSCVRQWRKNILGMGE